ncbi:MAG: DUF2161 domain-containing phosphodiesterase, partial [Planctomycetes bacterium]|nr:DUF2161 domain-containing phosphodiesterase [Planctomycetota bacterium]
TRRVTSKSDSQEIAGRRVVAYFGGSPGGNTMTAHREKALAVAVALERFGPAPKHLLCLTGASAMTGSILRRNKDGWFVRVKPGVYDLSDAGREALAKYHDLADALREKMARIQL